MPTLRRALAIGVAFGLAAAGVEAALTLIPSLERRFGPGPVFQAQVAVLQILLGALLGLAAAPLLSAPGGRLGLPALDAPLAAGEEAPRSPTRPPANSSAPSATRSDPLSTRADRVSPASTAG